MTSTHTPRDPHSSSGSLRWCPDQSCQRAFAIFHSARRRPLLGPSLGTVKLHEGVLTALVLHIPPSVDNVVAVVHGVVIQTPGLAVGGDTARRSETKDLSPIIPYTL